MTCCDNLCEAWPSQVGRRKHLAAVLNCVHDPYIILDSSKVQKHSEIFISMTTQWFTFMMFASTSKSDNSTKLYRNQACEVRLRWQTSKIHKNHKKNMVECRWFTWSTHVKGTNKVLQNSRTQIHFQASQSTLALWGFWSPLQRIRPTVHAWDSLQNSVYSRYMQSVPSQLPEVLGGCGLISAVQHSATVGQWCNM